jgi:hypothetical protein
VPEVIDSKYRILRTLGKGGCGTVFVAWHEALQKEVALKVLSDVNPESTELMRFKQEANALTACHHPSIVKIHAFGLTEDGRPYFVMDYIDGISLAAEIKKNGPLTPKRFALIFDQLLSALEHAHDAGLIHRDIKPSNIMLTNHGGIEQATLIDFGLTRALERDVKLTATNKLIGTPHYMSPEQCTGSAAVDQRSDIYSLGCTMLEAATGKLPFEGEAFQILFAHVNQAPDTVPIELVPLIEGCLAKEADKRFPNARAARSALQSLGLDRYEQFSTGKHTVNIAESGPRRKRIGWKLPAIGVLITITVVVAMFAFFHDQKTQIADEPPELVRPGSVRLANMRKVADLEFEAKHWKNAAVAALAVLNGANDNDIDELPKSDRLTLLGIYTDSARNAGYPFVEYRSYLREGIKLASELRLARYEREFLQRRGQEYGENSQRELAEADFQQAVSIADKAKADDPRPFEAYRLYAEWLRNWGQDQQAHDMIKKGFNNIRDREKRGIRVDADDEKTLIEFLEKEKWLKSDPVFTKRVIDWLEAQAQKPDTFVKVDRLIWIATIESRTGDKHAARATLERALTVARPFDKILTAHVLHCELDLIPMAPDEQLQTMQEAMALLKQTRSPQNEMAYITGLHHVASAYESKKEFLKAYETRVEAAHACHALALQHDKNKDFENAWTCYDNDMATKLYMIIDAFQLHDAEKIKACGQEMRAELDQLQEREEFRAKLLRMAGLRNFLEKAEHGQSPYQPHS